jgi:oligopeptide/dipeptide ABC transporter ATP-binding protein
LAIVGESGSGKSVGVLALMGLLPQPPAAVGGSVHYRGQELLGLSPKEWRGIRGKGMAMIFQDPMTSLNPVRTVGYQLTESMAIHLNLKGDAARHRAIELLELVGIPSPEARVDDYPHQLSGGMRQRVMIAMGLACDPDVLIADEATTALDVTTQAQITDLVAHLQDRVGMAVIWITHDLGVVASIADRVHVMYGGRFMEQAGADDIYGSPQHPYTEGLLGSLPMPGAERPDKLVTIPGLPPDPVAMPAGCPFAPRCSYADETRCLDTVPAMEGVGDAHETACHHPLGVRT